ncbi:hypothetical protein R1sor_003879 [Riccia sorocarpa]|uniref:Uncharacterized protein n=1 Tax=Riccia sorocarpa TaxID=122646 RepID=A0ABD3H5Q9_9MARC
MSLEDFEVVHLRGDRSDILNRCIGRQWMFQLTRIQNNRAPYAGMEHVEAVFKKELFPDPEDGVGVMNEAVGLRHRVFSPDKQVFAFGLGEVLSPRTVESRILQWEGEPGTEGMEAGSTPAMADRIMSRVSQMRRGLERKLLRDARSAGASPVLPELSVRGAELIMSSDEEDSDPESSAANQVVVSDDYRDAWTSMRAVGGSLQCMESNSTGLAAT